MHLCLWTDWGWEILHHDGATRARAAGHCAPGTWWDLAGQLGQEHLQLPLGQESKDYGVESWLSEPLNDRKCDGG